jgi:peptidoglycan/xylan/chitin deacetylase (PgdA/CDA1 family)
MSNRVLRIPKFVAWFYPRRIWYGPTPDFYLTFDDGPHPEITPKLLAYLREEQIQATFFWQGELIEKYPELLKEALGDGHTIGHHGYKHVSNKKLPNGKFQLNFEKSQALIPHGLYRPPKGDISSKQAKYVLKSNKIVMWSYLSYDWDDSFSCERVVENFKKGLGPADVAVFHENDKTKDRIFQIIPKVIHSVREKGLNFAALPKK